MANRENPRKSNRPQFSEEVLNVLDAFVQMGIINYSRPDDMYFRYEWYNEKITYVDFELEKYLGKIKEEKED
jgi:hypothetical protein